MPCWAPGASPSRGEQLPAACSLPRHGPSLPAAWPRAQTCPSLPLKQPAQPTRLLGTRCPQLPCRYLGLGGAPCGRGNCPCSPPMHGGNQGRALREAQSGGLSPSLPLGRGCLPAAPWSCLLGESGWKGAQPLLLSSWQRCLSPCQALLPRWYLLAYGDNPPPCIMVTGTSPSWIPTSGATAVPGDPVRDPVCTGLCLEALGG